MIQKYNIGSLIIRISLWLAGSKGRLEALLEEPSVIRFIRNPTDTEQLLAVQEHPFYIQFIKNPCHATQTLAINKNRDAILLINNPSDEIAMLAKLME